MQRRAFFVVEIYAQNKEELLAKLYKFSEVESIPLQLNVFGVDLITDYVKVLDDIVLVVFKDLVHQDPYKVIRKLRFGGWDFIKDEDRTSYGYTEPSCC